MGGESRTGYLRNDQPDALTGSEAGTIRKLSDGQGCDQAMRYRSTFDRIKLDPSPRPLCGAGLDRE